MDYVQILNSLGVIFGLTGIAGALIAYLQANRQKTTVEILQTDNEVLRNRVSTLEDTEERCQQRLTHLETMNKALTETVTSAAKVDDLTSKVTVNQKELLDHLAILKGMIR